MPPPCAWPLYDVIKLPINRWRKHPVEASWFSSTDVSRNAFAVHSFGSISRGRSEHDARKFGELLATITRRIRRKFPRKFVLAVNETIGEVRTTLRIDSIYFLWKDFVPSFSHFIILDNILTQRGYEITRQFYNLASQVLNTLVRSIRFGFFKI